MCGIAGFISKNLNEANLKAMTNAIRHRGPNAEGFFYDQNEATLSLVKPLPIPK
jgi:asparagine synthetase B (glutamine-hydrolysing)